MTRYATIAAILLAIAFTPFSFRRPSLKIGSKKFTESVILGELLVHLSRADGVSAEHYQELGGTKLVFEALCGGDIDIYPEYTGTIRQEIFAGRRMETVPDMRAALRERGVRMSEPLGFNNSYALGMKRTRAAELGIAKVSDLGKRPDLKFGFSSEFISRADGWPDLRDHYGLSPRDVKGLDHDLAYRQLDAGAIDVIDIYTTDAKLKVYDIVTLEDDLGHFPRYDAVLLYREDAIARFPGTVRKWLRLEGEIDDNAMIQMNMQAELSRARQARVSEAQVAADFLADRLGVRVQVAGESVVRKVWRHTVEHVDLVRKSLVPAILLAIPLGVFAAKYRTAGQVTLALVGIIQTIPALALLVVLMTPVRMAGFSSIGAGSMNAVLALFLYSLLPIVRNTYAGLQDIPPGIHESALALGLPPLARLRLVELPLASRTILAGIKTAAVMNVGFATLGALVGAGGFGQPILTGIRLNDTGLITQGAISAAVFALLVQGIFELAERGAGLRALS